MNKITRPTRLQLHEYINKEVTVTLFDNDVEKGVLIINPNSLGCRTWYIMKGGRQTFLVSYIKKIEWSDKK